MSIRERLTNVPATLWNPNLWNKRVIVGGLGAGIIAVAGLTTQPHSATPTPVAAASETTDRSVQVASRSGQRVELVAVSKPAAVVAAPPAATPPAPIAVATPAAPPAAPPAPVVKPLPTIPGLSTDQMTNAKAIVDAGKNMNVSSRGQVIAIATALQESRLRNLRVAVDHDSLGLFQQRPSSGWGAPSQLTDPNYAATKFYKSLVTDHSDWNCLTCAAQRVQGSAFPDAYAKHEALATQIVTALS